MRESVYGLSEARQWMIGAKHAMDPENQDVIVDGHSVHRLVASSQTPQEGFEDLKHCLQSGNGIGFFDPLLSKEGIGVHSASNRVGKIPRLARLADSAR